jgi:DNA replication protein DnaC
MPMTMSIPERERRCGRFELIAERYERRSLLITANQPVSHWDQVLPDHSMTAAASDRPLHHATIFELHAVASYRGKAAIRQSRTVPATVSPPEAQP